LEINSQSLQEKAEEVYRASTTSQPEQHINNANAKCKKPQTAPTHLCTVNRTQQQTNSKQNNTQPRIFGTSMQSAEGATDLSPH